MPLIWSRDSNISSILIRKEKKRTKKERRDLFASKRYKKRFQYVILEFFYRTCICVRKTASKMNIVFEKETSKLRNTKVCNNFKRVKRFNT